MLVNLTPVTQVVKVVLANGKTDSINIQPNGRAVPPAGSVLDPRYHAQYAKLLKGTDSYKAVADSPKTKAK
jgi:hypothetical protein